MPATKVRMARAFLLAVRILFDLVYWSPRCYQNLSPLLMHDGASVRYARLPNRETVSSHSVHAMSRRQSVGCASDLGSIVVSQSKIHAPGKCSYWGSNAFKSTAC